MLCINSAGGNDQDVQRRIELARSYMKILDRDLWKSCISLPSKIRLQNFIHHLCDHVWCRCLEPDSGIVRDVCMRSTSSAYGTFSASRIQLMSVILKSAWELGSFWLQNSSSRDDSNCLAMLPELAKLKITSVHCEHLSTHLVTGDGREDALIRPGYELSVTTCLLSGSVSAYRQVQDRPSWWKIVETAVLT